MTRRIVPAVCVALLAILGASSSNAVGSPHDGDDAQELGERALGESCTRDCQCASLECKGFKCVVRDYDKHPILDKGAACVFDGDCRSCDCAHGVCK